MAIFFNRVPESDFGTRYTHFGRLYGLVPIYIGDPDSLAPEIAVVNGLPDWLIDVADLCWNAAVWVRSAVDPNFEHPGFMLEVRGEFRRRAS